MTKKKNLAAIHLITILLVVCWMPFYLTGCILHGISKLIGTLGYFLMLKKEQAMEEAGKIFHVNEEEYTGK